VLDSNKFFCNPEDALFLQHAAVSVFLVRLLGLGLSRRAELRAGLAVLVIAFALWAFHYRKHLSSPLRMALLCGLCAFLVVFSIREIQVIHERAKDPPPWDFQVFWIYGQLLAQGANPYQVEPYQRFEQVLHPEPRFVESVLEVGATYPPPTLFLFRPLGGFNLPAAYIPWQIFLCACLAVSIEMLRRLFLAGSGLWGVALAAVAVLTLYSTWFTVRVAQTNFLVMLLLLLYWRDRELPRGGLWLGLGAMVKLDVVLVALFPIVRRQWRQLGWAVGVGAALSAASMAWLGPRTFFSYFTQNPTSRLPFWVYTEDVNQSLLAVILRHFGETPGRAPVAHPVYVGLALVLIALTAWLVHRSRRDSEWGLALVIALALVLYPGTLIHYAVILLGPLFLVWKNREAITGGVWLSAWLFLGFYVLIGLAQANSGFLGIFLTWVAMAVASVVMPSVQARTQAGVSA
jgi:hypothetical protein